MLKEQIGDSSLTEDKIKEYAPYLGAFFGVGGTIGTDPRCEHVRPFIKFLDNSEGRVARFKQSFGGSKREPLPGHWLYYLGGERAVYLGALMKPFMPSRKSIMELFFNWDYLTPEERFQKALELKSHQDLDKLEPDEYYYHLRRPLFLAGIVDGRGIPSLHKERNHDLSPRIEVGSKNKAILWALKREFTGCVSREGFGLENQREFMGYKYDGRLKGKCVWKAQGRQVEDLFRTAYPYLIARKQQVGEIIDTLAA